MTQSTQRIQALERELGDIITYLRRLPLVPETARIIRQAEDVLSEQAPPAALVGESRSTPVGLVPVRVELWGDQLTVRSDVPESTALSLWRVLSDGVTVRLRPK